MRKCEGLTMQAFDLDSAITMHRSWKMKFHLAIDRIRGDDFDTQSIGDDGKCALGAWLSANAGELAELESARALPAIHREFHRQAQAIAEAISSGRILRRTDTAIVEFGALSEGIEAQLLKLKADLGQAG